MKFNASYFKYDKNGGNEIIKNENYIGKTRLVNLLKTSSFSIDVFHVENADTCEEYLTDSDGQSILLDDLNYPGVNGIFSEGEKF